MVFSNTFLHVIKYNSIRELQFNYAEICNKSKVVELNVSQFEIILCKIQYFINAASPGSPTP